MSVSQKLVELGASLAQEPTASARLAWLVAHGRAQPSLPPEQRIDSNLVPGCLSRLWLVADFRDGCCWFQADSDSRVVRAVAGVLCEVASGAAPRELLGAEPDLPARLGLDRLLTPNRRAAQSRIWEHILGFAALHAGLPSL